MKSPDIRQKFLDFFENKGHKIVPSAPLVLKDDPTLMFTNAGMNQFKDYFLGTKKAASTRIADTQKCLRVSGKHNDLEDVGKDTYHHTMFEMLGNWSFGDYFKKEAIDWAWELLSEVYGLPADRMYATVFEGDDNDGLSQDNEAFELWKKHLPEDRILMAGKKDNFWEMGDTGPCGPCSEVHIDLRTDDEIKNMPGRNLVNQDHPLVIEIWNLVFIQYNRLASGKLEQLPARHVDTGMGFERLAMAIQKKTSNYDTDIFTPLISFVESRSAKKYGEHEPVDIAIRVVADHIRAIVFAIADGQLPSNNKAGYVIRRILRRAVRYGFSTLEIKEPFLNEMVEILDQQMGEFFPELRKQKEFIRKAILEEEIAFLRTLENGLKRLENFRESGKISGKEAFELYDTYGFPLDLTQLIAAEQGIAVDHEGFTIEMKAQKSRSRAAAEVEKGDWVILEDTDTEFLGYDHLQAPARIIRYREVRDKKKAVFQVVLDKTPFYAASGGQVGDKGVLAGESETLKVLDTIKENELIVHLVDKLPDETDQTFEARVDTHLRTLAAANHSATHLLHAALREVLGQHVEQRGSLVAPDMLRFDFSHFSKMTEEEILRVEHIVNERIRQNIHRDEKRNIPIAEAKNMGAMALFGEKYGDFVRLITFDQDFSVELCGGTHVGATGEIGFFKIISESSISAGVRRIEAITSEKAEEAVYDQDRLIREIKDILKSPKDITKAILSLVDEKNRLQKEIEKFEIQQAENIKATLKKAVKKSGDIHYLITRADFPNADSIKKAAFELKNEVDNLFLGIASVVNDKPLLTVIMNESLLEKGLNASDIVRNAAKAIQGGGGGQPFYATAGGKDSEGIEEALKSIENSLKEKV